MVGGEITKVPWLRAELEKNLLQAMNEVRLEPGPAAQPQPNQPRPNPTCSPIPAQPTLAQTLAQALAQAPAQTLAQTPASGAPL